MTDLPTTARRTAGLLMPFDFFTQDEEATRANGRGSVACMRPVARTRYRPEIDGFRALAVIPVIFFHAGFDIFSGGFVGVDIFFVISGYLITGIIYEEITDGTFSIVRFYERRVRRILPALIFVSVACIPVAWLWIMPREFKDFAQSLVAVNLFVSNVLFWRESGYFSPAAELMPLLHTWSLAVEEQFYLLFPLFLLLFRNLGQKALILLLVLMAALSFGAAEWSSMTSRDAGFYFLTTRAWELGIGAILAVSADAWARAEGRMAHVGSALGLGMVVYAIFTFDESLRFPSVWALIPVLGAAFVIAYARPQTIVGKVLGWRPIVGIGLISYSAYLWHQPLFAFARIRHLDSVSSTMYLVLSGATIGLAYLSWRFVERPFRNRAFLTTGQIFSGAAIASAAVITFGLVVHFEDGLPGRFSPKVLQVAAQMAAWSEDKGFRKKECMSSLKNFINPEKSCVHGSDASPNIALVGDSHAMILADQMAEILSDYQHGLREFSFAGCAPAVGVNFHRSSGAETDCPRYNLLTRDFLLANEQLEVVILSARWPLYLEGHPFDNREGGVEDGWFIFALPADKGPDFISNPTRVAEVGQLFRSSIDRLLEGGKRIVLVYPVPEAGWNVPNYLAKEFQHGIARHQPLTTSHEVFKARTRNAREQLDMLANHPNLIRIRPEEIFCDTYVPGRCTAQLRGDPLYADDDHLNSIGSTMLSKKIVEAMKAKGWL